GVTFDPVTNTISGTPAGNASQLGDPGTPGVYTIPVTATDPNGATFTTNVVFTITNPPPVVTVDIPDQVGIDGYDVTIDTAPHFDDPDNDDLTYGAVGLPTGLTIDPLTGLITGTLDGNASNGGPGNDGFYPVTITVDDGEGGTVSTTFIFDANPVVVSFPDVPPVGLPLPPDGPDDPPNGDPGLTVTGTVNGFTPLGNSTALGPDLVVTNAVNGIRSLGGGTALDSNQPITEAIRNQIETDRETGIGFSIYGREGIALEGPYLYLGGQIDTGLHSSRGDITVRTMVYQTHMYVDLMTFGNAPLKDWSVRMSNGQPVPSWINMPGSNLVLIERVADVGRVNLDIIAHLKTGEKVVFPVHLDMTSGEIVLHARAYQISSVETVQNQQTASATPLSDEITRLANAGGDATRALFNT
ncbi:MAG: putative Ig domain-containing protein, partial [Rhizobiaceae bacterium]